MSVADTIIKCFEKKEHRRALKLRHDFRLSDRRWCWLKLRGLAQAGLWADLERFAKNHQPLIGFKPLVAEDGV